MYIVQQRSYLLPLEARFTDWSPRFEASTLNLGLPGLRSGTLGCAKTHFHFFIDVVSQRSQFSSSPQPSVKLVRKINLPRILSQLLLPPTDQTKKLQRNYNSWTFSPPGRSESSVSQNCLVWLYFYILPGLALVLHFARLAGSCQENVCKYLYGGQLRSKLLLRSRGLVSRYYWHKYEFPK